MRTLFVVPLALLTACQQEAEPPAEARPEARQQVMTYAGVGRDRLCLDEGGRRIGFITYGEGDENCSVRAAVGRDGERLSIVPDGDESCRIDATIGAGRVVLGPVSPSCTYYCGPDVSFAGKSFQQLPEPEPVGDLAGDPLC